ncbi:MAG: hypothetical protein ABIR32_22400 [Ilumatobacteraceae bacterium]
MKPVDLDAELAAALGIARTARPKQVIRAVFELVGHDDLDDDPVPPAGAAWIRHVVELIGEHDWRAVDLDWLAERVAADSVSDLDPAEVPAALKIVAPSNRATGEAATTALKRFLPRYCQRLITLLRIEGLPPEGLPPERLPPEGLPARG